MMKLERFEQRLRAIYFKRKFPERVEEIQPVRRWCPVASRSASRLC